MSNLFQDRARTLPYLAFGIAFVLLIGRGYFGFETESDGAFIAAAHRFSCGFLPFVDEWSIEQTAAWLVTPLYNLYLQLAGSATGVLLIARMVMAVLALAVCTVTYRKLEPAYGPLSSCCICLALPLGLLTLSPAPQDALGMLFLSLTFTFGFGTWQLTANDDGRPGLARVVCPLLCGAFAVLSIVACGVVAFIVDIALAIACPLVLTKRTDASPRAAMPWIACGVLVAAACYALITFTASSPAKIFDNLGYLTFAFGVISPQAAIFVLAVAVLALCVVFSGKASSSKPALALGCVVSAALLVPGAAALITYRTGNTVQLTEGPASGVSVPSEEAAEYNGILELAAIANTGDVVAFTGNSSWAATLVTGNLNQPSAWDGQFTPEKVSAYYEKRLYPEWVLMPADSTESSDANEALATLGTYGSFKNNEAGTLYKRASKLSYIS